MTPCSCTFCDARLAAGILFDDPTIRICRGCRDLILTYLTHLDGVIVSDLNPLIAELCEDSHYIASACWTFYDLRLQTQGKVLRLKK